MAGYNNGSSKASESQLSEVQGLMSSFEGQFKTMRDVGDFTHVISLTPNDMDLTLKLQLPASYPDDVPEIIIRSSKLSPSEISTLLVKLKACSEELLGSPMAGKLMEVIQQWTNIQGINLESTTHKSDQTGSKKRNRRKGKNCQKKKPREMDEDALDSKKASMKTAMDVISRILWDDDLPNDCFAIGYVDRFIGVVEKPFTAFSWEDIASVDYRTLAIPKHRIQYFKYKDIKVWDKASRLDNVFGSVGSGITITDVITSWPEGQAKQPVQAEVRDDAHSDDDDVDITLGGSDDEWEQDTNIPYWGEKLRPNYFLALRVTDPDVMAAVQEAQKIITDIDPSYEECLIPTSRLHVTLWCLGLDTEDQLFQAINFLHEIKPELQTFDPLKMKLKFNDIGNFFHNTLYASVECSPSLMEFVEHIRACLVKHSVEIRNVFDFVPHMTLLKLKRCHQKARNTRYLDPRIYRALEGKDFCFQIMNNIHLCSMSEEKQCDGFYISPSSIHFTS